MINKTLNNIFKGDKVIWMVFFFLCIISIIEVYSASSQLTYKNGSYLSPVLKHIGILLMGIFCMVVTLNIKCKYFKIVTPFLLIISVLMLIWVLFAGQSTNGAARWVGILDMGAVCRTEHEWCCPLGGNLGNEVPAIGDSEGRTSAGDGTDSECHADGERR